MGKKILVSWLGITDLKAAGQAVTRTDENIDAGPILGAIKNLNFDELHILHDQERSKTEAYVTWLSGFSAIKVILI